MRARIGYTLSHGAPGEPGRVRSILVWTDGGPDPTDCGVGEALIARWNNDNAARLLVAGGDMVTLRVNSIQRVPGQHPAIEHSIDDWPGQRVDYEYLWGGEAWFYRVPGAAWMDL